MQSRQPPIERQAWKWMPLFIFLYVALGEVSLRHFSMDGRVSVVWLPAGLGLAAVLRGGVRYVAALLLVDFLATGLRGEPWLAALLIACGNAAAAGLSAWVLLNLTRFKTSLESLRDYSQLMAVGGVGGGLVSALVGVNALHGFGGARGADFANTVLSWWAGDCLGAVLFSPLVLAWWFRPSTWLKPARLREGILLLLLAFLVGQVVLVGWLRDPWGILTQPYWLFVVLAMYSPRMLRHGISLVSLIFAGQGMFALAHGQGMFLGGAPALQLPAYWVLVTMLAIFGMASTTYFERLRKAQFDVAQQEANYRSQFADNSAVLLLFDLDGRVIDANQTALRFYGHGREAFLQLTLFLISDRTAAEVRDTLQSVTPSGGGRFESKHRLADGSVRDVVVSNSPVRMGDRFVMHSIVFDITDQKRAEAEIENLAFYDPLTKLPNRRLLMDRLGQALASGTRSGRKGALLFIDLDNFKALNDAHGHEKGDQLLLQTGQRLKDCVRTNDTVARLGGDEFVVMLKDLQPTYSAAGAQVKVVGTKILEALKLPYQLDSVEHRGSGSVGIVLFGEQADSIEELFKRADIALYEAKGKGRNAFRFFDPAMQAAMAVRAQLDMELRRAVDQQQFVLYYQPQVDEAGHITGVEALLRWRHPLRGMVLPGQFIGLAEETGIIVPLGHWVLRQACTQLAVWRQHADLAGLTVSVNVSARQFRQADYVRDVMDVVVATGAPAQRIKLELTESLLVTDIEDIIAKMTRLKNLGLAFSLDDFGTGYSSLAYLKRLPLDQLKIDQTFVRDLLTDSNDAAIARTVVALGHSLGLAVIAEGVENQAQRDFLWQTGCRAFQGFYFGKPMTAAEIETRVHTEARQRQAVSIVLHEAAVGQTAIDM